MQKVRVPITNFQFGEVSPSLYSRTDTAVYTASAQRVENLFLRAEGGVIKRAGLQNIYAFDTTYDATKVQQSRLLPFIFSDDERYIISMEHQKLRIFQINATTGAVSLIQTITQDTNSDALKFTHTYMHEFTYAQAGDVMFICHPTFMPQQIVRTGLTTFQVETFIFDVKSDTTEIYQPYYSFHPIDITLDPSATTGTGVTLTTSSAYFDITGSQSGGNYPDSLHVGITLKYRNSEIEITSVQSTTQATGTVQDKLETHLDPNAFRTTEGNADIEVTFVNHGMKVNDSIVVSHAGTVGGISSNQINGTRTVASIVDDDRFIFTAGANANESVDGGGTPKIETHAPTAIWSEQSYSALRGYPSAVTFHQNRLVFAGTLAQPDTIWFSKSASYYNFNVYEARDNDSIHLTASVGEVNQIRHIVSNRDLQVFTSTSEMYVPAFTNQPLTPTNAQIRRQTPFGVDFVRPQSLDGATLFVQKGGAIIREYLFSDAEAAYTAVPISSLSSHLIKIFNSNRGEQRAGWAEFTSQGKFHSCVTVDDRVFANVVFDTGAGTEKIHLCEFDSTYNTDMSGTYTGTAGVFDVSADFANGAVVNVISGNNYVGEFTVASGNVDVSSIDNTLTSVEIGYKFNVNLKTNPIDVQAGNGPITGQPRSLASVIVDLNTTLSASVNGTNLVIRQVTDDLSQQLSPFTGKKEFRLMGYNRDPQVEITQSAPLSMQVNGIIAELVF
jgi:hypothetical protein